MRLKTAIITGISGVFALVAVGMIIVSRIDANGYYRSTIINKVEQETGRKLVLGGELKLSFFPSPALTVNDVALSNPPWAPVPQMVTIGRLSANVALLPLIFGGNLRIDRLDLKDVNLQLATDAHGQGNWETGPEKAVTTTPAPVSQAALPLDLPSFGEVTLENIVIAYDDGQSGKSATISLAHLALSGSSESPINLKASALYQGLPIEFSATLGPLSALMTSKAPYPISADILAAGANLKISGSINEPLSARGINCVITLDGPNLGLIGKSAGASLPEKPYHLTATVTNDADGRFTLKALQASVGSSKISGDATVDAKASRPKINATLDASMIDLTEFPPGPSARRSDQDDRLFSKDKLPLAALSAIDADIALSADEVKSNGVLLRKLSLHLTLDDRDLRVKSVSFNLGAGQIGGEVDYLTRQSPPVLSADITGKDLDFGTLLTQLSGYDLLEGRGSLALAAHGSGDSVRAIMASLDGSSSLVIGRGLIKNRYADLIGADVFREAFAWTQGKKDSKLTCMVSRFDYRDGLGTARDLLIDTSDVTIVGSGTVNLGSERLNLELLPRPKETSLLSLAVPIDIGGSLPHPSVQTNRMAMAKDAVKGIVTWINPLYALIPLVLNADQDTNPCVTMLQAKSAGTQKQAKTSTGIGGFMNSAESAIGSVFK